MKVVAALGGNALIRRGDPADIETQRGNLARAAASLAEIAEKCELVITHGNGPHVGLLALQSTALGAEPYPLDVLGAQADGMIGYLLDQELGNRLPDRTVATLLTQVEVDSDDPAFTQPTKPIGPQYSQADADRLARERDFTMALDGDSWRRVVASPEPRRIVEIDAVRVLVAAGVQVVCVGGGGVPVVLEGGRMHGVEAVIDKDLAATLLARQLKADVLLLLTDVRGIELGWGTPDAELLRRTTPEEVRALDLASGSMGPKAEAAARFAEVGGTAVIANLDEATEALAGTTGTVITTRG